MASETFTSKKNGALFVQPGGPNTSVSYLGCFDVDDIVENRGALTLLQCLTVDGDYETVGFTEAAPDVITFNMGTYTGKRREALEQVKCPMAIYLLLRDCGKADVFDNFVRGAVVDIGKMTSRTLSGWVRKGEDTPAMTTFEASALPPVLDFFKMSGKRQSISETEALNNIIFCNALQCDGPCGEAKDVCEDGFITSDAAAGSPANQANVLSATDGATWAATAANPFAGGEDIVGAACFPMDKSTTRVIVGRGTADAGNPLEIAYSDDSGATWTLVNVGSTNGQYVADSGGLFALDKNHVWIVTQDGYIYFSNDAGATWTAQESGVITASAYNAIWFSDALTGMAVGAGDIVAVTVDGGTTWSAATATGGGNALATVTYNGLFWWTGDSGGDLYYSIDQGTTWNQRTGYTGESTGDIASIRFLNKYFGLAAHNITNVGYVLATVDGGANWVRTSFPTNGGLNDLHFCSEVVAYAAGEASGGTGFVAKIQVA